ncbi:hypothetical protein BBP40_002763 [Aspergillus hancockii]|nr:hypothetical protein BBP40_002763 [Aspergillus hancockii]
MAGGAKENRKGSLSRGVRFWCPISGRPSRFLEEDYRMILHDTCCKAISHGHVGVLRVLAAHGARMDDPLNELFIMAAERGVDLDFRNEDGRTALEVAAKKCHSEIVQFLTNASGDVDARVSMEMMNPDLMGVAGAFRPEATALRWAACSSNTETVQVLIDNGACLDPATPNCASLWPIATPGSEHSLLLAAAKHAGLKVSHVPNLMGVPTHRSHRVHSSWPSDKAQTDGGAVTLGRGANPNTRAGSNLYVPILAIPYPPIFELPLDYGAEPSVVA